MRLLLLLLLHRLSVLLARCGLGHAVRSHLTGLLCVLPRLRGDWSGSFAVAVVPSTCKNWTGGVPWAGADGGTIPFVIFQNIFVLVCISLNFSTDFLIDKCDCFRTQYDLIEQQQQQQQQQHQQVHRIPHRQGPSISVLWQFHQQQQCIRQSSAPMMSMCAAGFAAAAKSVTGTGLASVVALL